MILSKQEKFSESSNCNSLNGQGKLSFCLQQVAVRGFRDLPLLALPVPDRHPTSIEICSKYQRKKQFKKPEDRRDASLRFVSNLDCQGARQSHYTSRQEIEVLVVL